MSTIKVTNLQNASAASPAIVLDTNGQATLNGLSYPTEGSLSGRNRIINGDTRIDQRNAGASFSAAAATLVYGIDRFYHYQTGAGVTAQRISSGLTDFPNALRVTGASGNTACEVSQRIESVNCADLVGKTVTVSFTAAHSGNGTVSVGLINPNGVDNYSATTSIESKTQVLTSTLTRYSLSFNALPAGAANGLLLVFNNASGLGSGVTFTITGVQLEAGSVATPFERRSYGQELALCQRYYEKSYPQSTKVGQASAGNLFVYPGTSIASGNWYLTIPFKVTKRAAPTVTTYPYTTPSNTNRFSDNTGADYGANSATPSEITDERFSIYNGTAGSLTNSGQYIFGAWSASAEL